VPIPGYTVCQEKVGGKDRWNYYLIINELFLGLILDEGTKEADDVRVLSHCK
jgi:hypothetical protein